MNFKHGPRLFTAYGYRDLVQIINLLAIVMLYVFEKNNNNNSWLLSCFIMKESVLEITVDR